MAMVIQIQAPHFTASAIIMDGRVLSAAPIIKYMQGWHTEEVLKYGNRKGWTVKVVRSDQGDENERTNNRSGEVSQTVQA